MHKEAVDYYHELLGDRSLAAASVETLDAGLESSKLIFGGRRLSPYLRPHFVRATDWRQIKRVCETIFAALNKVKDAAIADESILQELGLTGIERELVRIDPGYSHVSANCRLDSFLTEDAYSYVELNGESPAGVAYADSATAIFESLPVMQKFSERYSVSGFEGRSKMLDVLLQCYEEFLGRKPEKPPTIAIVDLKGLPTQKEFELFKDYFESRGYASLIAAPDELEFSNGKLSSNGTDIDIVYKRLLVNEYLPIMKEAPALIDAYRAGGVCVVNSFQGKIVHKKAIFAVLTDEKYASLFDEAELTAIHDHVPWTRRVAAGKTINHDEEIDIVEWTRRNASQLALKPSDDYGGHGIVLGWTSSESEWDDAIQHALDNGDYLVQQRVKTAKERFPMITDEAGNWEMVEQLVDLDPLLFLGKAEQAFTRLSSNELANVTAGGGMVPTFIIED
jgi:uncharacterized circularly permuted ATP-grasp superfamily protein